MREYSEQELHAQISYHRFYAERCKTVYDQELSRVTIIVDAKKSYILPVDTKDGQLVQMFRNFLSELMDYHVRKRMVWESVYERQTGKTFDVGSIEEK